MSLKSAPFWWIVCDFTDCAERCPEDGSEFVAWESDDQAEQVAQDSEWWVEPSPWGGASRHWCPEHHHVCEAREDFCEDARQRWAAEDCPDCVPAVVSSDYTPGTRPAVGDRVRIEAEGVVGIVRGGDEPRYFVRLDENDDGLDDGQWFGTEFFDVTVLAPALPPEPAIWSVVLDADGNSYQHIPPRTNTTVAPHFTWQTPGSTGFFSWKQLNEQYGPIYLIHDAGVSADPARVRAPGNSEETRPSVAAVPVTPETPGEEHGVCVYCDEPIREDENRFCEECGRNMRICEDKHCADCGRRL